MIEQPTDPTLPNIVIIGGGFAGLTFAKHCKATGAEIILIDRQNHHVFQPLLYQVATAALSPANIAEPIRKILARQRNCQVLMAAPLSLVASSSMAPCCTTA